MKEKHPPNGCARYLTEEEARHTGLTPRCLLVFDESFSIWLAQDDGWVKMSSDDTEWTVSQLRMLWEDEKGAPVQLLLHEG